MTEVAEDKPTEAKSRVRPWKTWWARTVAGVSIIAAILTIIGFALGYLPHHGPGIKFTNPQSGEPTRERCTFTVSGRGVPSAGKVLVLSIQEHGVGNNVDPLVHLVKATTKPDADQWSSVVVIGNATTKPGTPFALDAWLIDANWINYLTHQVYPVQSWWSSYNLPPTSKRVGTVNVIRIGGAMKGCPLPSKA